MSAVIGVGLFGSNGHQVHKRLVGHPHARLVAITDFPRDALPDALRADRSIREYATLESLLADDAVHLVSLCSDRREDQARHAIAALEAGKDVYAEKPAALNEADLDQIVATATRTGRRFHEMAGSAFAQPYRAMRDIVQSGAIGTVVQVLGQKSYPWHDRRPDDQRVDGGLIRQAAVHATRWVEHVAGVRIAKVQAVETSLGGPSANESASGGLRMAATLMFTLENGGVGAIIANYLNPRGIGTWGNETLRIFGTLGMLESTDAGRRTRLVIGDTDHGPIDASAPSVDYFDLLIDAIRGVGEMPFTSEEELHPTRIVIRAKASADAAKSCVTLPANASML